MAGFVALGATRSWAAVAANATLFIVLLWLSTVAHEAGHALAARALKIRVSRVTVGFGPSLFTLHLFGLEWRFGSVPFDGATFAVPKEGQWLRLRVWLTIAAGPLVTAFLVGFGTLFVETDAALEIAPARMLQSSNGFLLALSLIPMRFPGRGVPASDGLLLFLIWRMPQPTLNDLRTAEYHEVCVTALEKNRTDEAAAACAAGLAEAPENVGLLNADALIDIRAGHFKRAREKFLALLDRSDLAPQLRPLVRNNVAWTAVMLNDADMLREADEISRDVVKHMPMPNAYATRGAVLVLRGKPWRAIVHLRRAYERHHEDFASAHAAAWLGAAEAALGHFAEAEEWLATAEALDPDCQSLTRARRLVNRRRKRHERLRARGDDASPAGRQ